MYVYARNTGLLLGHGIHGGCGDNERFFGLIYRERTIEEIFIENYSLEKIFFLWRTRTREDKILKTVCVNTVSL